MLRSDVLAGDLSNSFASEGGFVPAFWMTSANFGDNCNLLLLAELSGCPVVFTAIDEPVRKVVAVGSILNWCDSHCVAWGPGLASASDCVNPHADIRATRGPLSRQRARECGNKSSPALGDPVLLLPKVFRPIVEKKYRLGIVPHYVDQLKVGRMAGNRWEETGVVNVFESPEKVVRAILSCERIVSSSLHGIIAAHAYGIPAQWVSFGGPIGGDGMKFRDYFESVGVKRAVAVDLAGAEELARLERISLGLDYCLPAVDLTRELIQSAPFRIRESLLV